MKATLNNLFRHYGKVIDVVAHGNLRMRGQAFVSFPDAEIAKKAMREVKGFPLYGKPLVGPFSLPSIHFHIGSLANILCKDSFRSRCQSLGSNKL
jgi:RNA recognition motif-containing protein